MKKNIFITRSAVFNWFSLAKSLLDSGIIFMAMHGMLIIINKYYK